MFQLRPISKDAVQGAIAKAEHYRLLQQAWQAESICRDILAVDRGNQIAAVTLLLALTDQFEESMGASEQEALQLADGLTDEYEREYYHGLIYERRAIAIFRVHGTKSRHTVYRLFQTAMEHYDKATHVRPPHNDDVLLRWNSCVRFLKRNWEFK
jgi:hypothetical protein